jgi:RNA polymerase sigma factor (sigma-70 family)
LHSLVDACHDLSDTELIQEKGCVPWHQIIDHRERLTRIVRRRLADPQDVEDCVQEAILRAASYKNLDRARIGHFLTSVAMRLCVDHYRHADRNRRLAQRAVSGVELEGPEEHVCDVEFARWLFSQLVHLKGREREVMLARAAGVSTVEFARRNDISVKSAESAFTRARAHLSRLSDRELHAA